MRHRESGTENAGVAPGNKTCFDMQKLQGCMQNRDVNARSLRFSTTFCEAFRADGLSDCIHRLDAS